MASVVMAIRDANDARIEAHMNLWRALAMR
jgi:hypothetical protein